MPITSNYNDYQPITWFRRMPIYFTTILTALYAAGIIATAILDSAGGPLHWFTFWTPLFFRGWLWQALTWTFINWPNFFTAISLVFFYMLGVDVERYLGRARFIKLLALFTLIGPAVMIAWSRVYGVPLGCAGNYELTIGIFITFATLYPNAEFFGWVPMKYFAFAGVVLAAMNYLPKHDWPGLTALLSTCAVAFGYVRFLQRGGSVEAR